VAINSVSATAAPFFVITDQNPLDDNRTRVTVFATGIATVAQNSDGRNDLTINGVVIPNYAESVQVEARRTDGETFLLPAEFAGSFGTMPPLEQVNVMLAPQLQGWGVVQLTLIINGQRSNSATIVVH